MNDLKARGISHESTPDDFESYMAWAATQEHGGHSLVARGLYELQVAGWLEAWPRVLFIDSAELKSSAGAQREVL